MSIRLLASLSSLVVAATPGCSKPQAPAAAHPAAEAPKPSAPAPSVDPETEHGARTPLGRLSVGGWELELALLGALEPGKESAIEAKAVTGPAGRDWKQIGAYVWVEDAAGNPLTAPSKAVIENGQLHFHAAVPAGAATAAKVVVRVREDGKDERKALPVTPGTGGDAGSKPPAHTHEKTPHDGIIVAWKTGGTPPLTGFAEVKLHDDKGDVEVWLGKDRAFTEPFRLPVASPVTLTLVDLGGRTITLAARDGVENKDESGKAHVVDGQTDYVVFPGSSGQDPTALQGKAFSSVASLRFEVAGQTATSEEFLMQPHTHAPGQEH